MWLVPAADPGDHILAECWMFALKIPSEPLDSDLGVDFLPPEAAFEILSISLKRRNFAHPPLRRTIFPNIRTYLCI